jgi:DNA-binding transcriptional LysR family regulator
MLVPSIATNAIRNDMVVKRLPRSFPPREIYVVVPSDYQAPAADEMLACLKEVAESSGWE